MASNDLPAEALFTCRMCGDCCKGYGGTFVGPGDAAAIAAHLGLSGEEFQRRFCVRSGNRLLLAQRADNYCVFWDGRCAIHPVKPRMCRRWPFIESLIIDPANWAAMASCCPGMRTDIPPCEVRSCAARILSRGGGTPE